MAKTTLTITVGAERLSVSLSRSGGRSAAMTIPVGRDLDSVLIAELDSFLKRNTIDPLSLRTVTVRGAVDKFSSVYRIVKAWQQAVQSISGTR